jgi:O-6-methylguanine DNA methyltransferase
MDGKSRLISYGIFPSPLGHIMIGRSEQGVALLEYLHTGRSPRGSRASRIPGLELIEDGEEIESIWLDLRDYFEGKRTTFEWPLDLGLVRSDFHQEVLRATLKIPFGVVRSYTELAKEIGRPRAVRAVAQALRWNPLPIVIPCHRVIGSSGSLTGYCGNKILLKQRLLNLEGVPTRRAGKELRVNTSRSC